MNERGNHRRQGVTCARVVAEIAGDAAHGSFNSRAVSFGAARCHGVAAVELPANYSLSLEAPAACAPHRLGELRGGYPCKSSAAAASSASVAMP